MQAASRRILRRIPAVAAGAASLGFVLAPAAHGRGVQWHARSAQESAARIELEVEMPLPVRAERRVEGRSFAEIRFPGLAPEAAPGAPESWVDTRLVAVPPGGRARLRILGMETEELGVLQLLPRAYPVVDAVPQPSGGVSEFLREEHRFDAAAYAEAPSRPVAELGAPAVLRHQHVVPILVRPLLFDPATGRATLVRRLRLAIDLDGGRAGTGGAEIAAATPLAWERIYGGALVNPAPAPAWREAPARALQKGGPLPSGLLRPGLLGEDEWKVRVRETGPQRVTGAVLAAAGFPPSAPIGSLRLSLRRFAPAAPLDPAIVEIPIHVVDVDGDGAFEVEDSFLFIGEHPRDDATSEDTLARYTQENVYWLSQAGSGVPARMPVRAPIPGATPGPPLFAQELAFEQDRVVNRSVFGRNDLAFDTEETYFWTADRSAQIFSGQLQVPVARVTVPAPGRAAGATIQVCIETQEENTNRPFFLFAHGAGRDSVQIASNPGTLPSQGLPPARQLTCGTVPDAALAGDDLRVFIRPQVQAVGFGIPFLDRVRLAYTATYTAAGNRARVTSGGASGATRFDIAGFTAAELRAFDITDPKAPATFDLAGAFAAGTLQLTDDVPAAATRVYLVVADAAIPPVAAVEIDAPERDDLAFLDELATAPLGTYDGLVVIADALAGEPMLQQWRAFREAQGHRLRFVRTSDVYDAFRGGLPHYEAIHRACRLAFANWGIATVTLVGDGSEDAAGILPASGPNLVPARVRYFYVTGSSDIVGNYRNDLNDKYYAQVAGAPGDFLPDLLVARIPAGTTEELRAVLEKTMRYETPQPGDDGAWRKRVLMYADDEWVRRPVEGVSPFAHRRGCSEPGFERGIVQASDVVDGAFPGDLRSVRFLLRQHSDRLGIPGDPNVPFLPEHRPVPPESIFAYCFGTGQAHGTGGAETAFYVGTNPGQVGRALIDSVGAGCLFLCVQSHANRVVVGDESVFNVNAEQPFSPPFANFGKPFVFFGFGCHLNEYGVTEEEQSGDCLGERLVLVPSRGAVASYASTGFEYLDANNQFNTLMWRVIFEKRYSRELGGGAVSSDTLAARWGLAELLTLAEIQFATHPDGRGIIDRQILFADPMLRLDGGFPRIPRPTRITNGFLQADNRLVVVDPNLPVGLELEVRDEQGIDSLWVVQRFPGGGTVPIANVTITALADTAAQIRAKRAYRVEFEFTVGECNFDVVVGARDLAGRVTEFVGRVFFEERLLANGVPIESGDRVDPRSIFGLEIQGCTPIAPPLPLEVWVDGVRVPDEDVTFRSDAEMVNWTAEFQPMLADGTHTLRFVYDGKDFATYEVQVGGFGMSEVIAFPNPLTDRYAAMRIWFHLGEPISGGYLRVVDVNGRTVLRRDLADPGVVQSDVDVPPGQIGSSVDPDGYHWNYVEIFRDGQDARGDEIANGVYLYELSIRGLSGQTQRRRDRIVIMR